MTFYKVVTHDIIKQSLTSYLTWQKDFVLTYKKDVWTNPVFGKIFVFDSLDNARRYIYSQDKGNDLIHIYECKVQNPVKSHVVATLDYKAFWLNEECDVMDAPIGAYVASAVKLIGPNLNK